MKVLFLFLAITPASLLTLFDGIPEKGARYEYKRWECRIDGNSFTLKENIRLTIYNKKGEEYSHLSFVENKFKKIKSIDITVYDESGKVVYNKNIKDMSKAVGFGLASIYEDNILYFTEANAPQFPYHIEYEINYSSNTLFLWRGVQFQNQIPVNEASYKLICPIDFKFNYKMYNFDLEPVKIQVGNKYEYTWKTDYILPLEEFDYLVPGNNSPIELNFVPYFVKIDQYSINEPTWEEIGKWYNEMAIDCYDSQDTISQDTDIESIYNSIIKKIRYVAIEIGIGSWKPYRASLTENRGFGDCKDMTTLLISQINQIGVKAYPALVLTRDNGPIDLDFPNFGFNHVITMGIDGKDTIWMDPTCNNCAFRELPDGDEDIDVLVMDENGGKIVRTSDSKAEANKTERITTFNIDSERNVTLNTSIKYTGNTALYNRYVFQGEDDDETKRYIKNRLPFDGKRYELIDYSIENLTDIEKPLVVNFTAKSKKPTREISSVVYFNPFIYNEPSNKEKYDFSGRELPIYANYPYQISDSVVINYEFNIVPDSVELFSGDVNNFGFVSFEYNISKEGNKIYFNYDKKYNSRIIYSEQFDEYKKFCEKLREASSQNIKFHVSF